MAILTQSQPPFVVDLETEKNSAWPDGCFVYVKESKKTYFLDNGVFVGVFVVTGGLTGQVLTKISDTDYDINWQTPTGGGDSNLDGGNASSIYGGQTSIDGGGA